MIPFKIFDGYLKRFDINKLSNEQKSIFELVFSGFFFKEELNNKALNQAKFKETKRKLEEINLKHYGNEKPYNYRRFSGGSYLPKGNYYTVCKDSSGNDSHTLSSEIFAYYRAETGGEIVLLDLCYFQLYLTKILKKNLT